MSQNDERRLIHGILARRELALAELMRSYGGSVRGLCLAIVVDPLEADSVASDVFLELWNRPQRYDWQRGTLKTYLMTLARSRSVDRVRARAARHRKHETQDSVPVDQAGKAPDQQPDKRLDEEERQERIQKALEELPQSQRNPLLLSFFSGLSHREIAEKMGMPLGTVKTNIRKGLQRLRSSLASELSDGVVV